MKTSLVMLLSLAFSTASFARIVQTKDGMFVMNKDKMVPISLINDLIHNKSVSHIKLYDAGKINLLSFAKPNESEKLYSVDEKGFTYAIEPFSSYDVKSVDRKGFIRFAQAPSKKYFIDQKGYFIYR